MAVLLTGTTIGGNVALHAGNVSTYALPIGTGTSTGMKIFYTSLTNNDDWQNSPISIMERGLVGSAQSAAQYAPNLNFHWAGRASKSFWLDSSGVLRFGEYNASGIPATDGTIAAGAFSGPLSGNATTATTLQTIRTINGTNFNGSANIETSYWGTARTITIGGTGKSVNGNGNVSWSLGEIQAEYEVPLNTLRNNLGSPTVREAALFHGQFNNKFRFLSPTLQEESTNGTTWVTSTRASAAVLGDMMIGEGQGTSFSAIPSAAVGTYGAYRLTWNVVGSTGYVFLNALYIFNSTNGNTVNITIEALHNTNGWVTITGPHATSNWPGHAYIPHSNIPYSNSSSQYSQVRITFTTTHNTNINAFTIYGIEWFGGYPQGRRNAEYYDRDRNVYFPASIQGSRLISTVASGTAPLSVTSTTVVGNLNADMVDGYHSSSLWRSDGGSWNPSANILLGQTANSQEWSFDITRNGYTGGYWQVWDSANSTMLKVDAVSGKVSAPYNFVGNLEGSATTLATARTLTIGATGKNFDGSANVSWTLAEIGAQAAGSYLTTSGKAADSNLLDGIDSSGFQRQIDESIVNIGSPNASSGTWTNADTDDWGTPRIGSIAARYNDETGHLQFNVPAGMDSAYVSHLTWSSGGYVDCYGVQADGGLVFLRRINTRQSVENTNEGSNGGNPNQHDGSTISLVGTGLSSFSAVRLQNRVGRFHLTGMSFTSAKLQGTEGTGMVHPGQLSVSGSGSGLDADLLDGNHASAFALSSHTHSDATTSVAGFMSTADKTKLDGIAASANNYSLPLATASVRGGVKIGYTASGQNYPVQLSSEQMYVNVPWTDTDTNTTYSAGTGLTLSGTTFSVTAGTYAAASHNHTSLTGVTSIGFSADASDSASITTSTSSGQTTLNFNVSDDNDQDGFFWNFTPSGASQYQVMYLRSTSNNSGNLTVVGNITLAGVPTTTNQARTIDFTGFDKEGTTDFSDRAYIQHTVNTGGHSGSVLVISSQNDSTDGIAFETNASSKLKHNSNNIATEPWVTSQGYLTSLPSHTHTPSEVGLGNVSNTAQVTTTNNSSLNADSRNTRGVTRLYRNDSDSDFSVQTNWTGTHWHIRGYNGDTFHAEARVGYADTAGSATSATSATTAGSATTATTANRLERYGIIYGDDWNTYYQNNRLVAISSHNHTGSNRPTTAYTYGSGLSYYNSGSDHYQFFFPENGGSSNANNYKIHYRSGWNNNWGGWRTLIDLYNGVCAIAGSVTATGDITAYSDSRIKENVNTLEGALDKTLSLRGVSYNRTDIEDKSTKIGFIAQELLEVVPEVVTEDESGMYGVSYGNITALLVEAIKEQQKQIEELKLEIQKLKSI